MNAIQRYFRDRQSLIDQYIKGDLTKREYLQMNYDAVLSSEIKPFKNIDTIEKALYNYQYYNAFAKQMKSISTESNMEYDLKQYYLEKSDYYYSKKDKATLAVLKKLEYRNVTAYFVKVKSKLLKGRLFEIVLEEQDVILHSTNEFILKRLREEFVLQEDSRESLIDEYVNHKY